MLILTFILTGLAAVLLGTRAWRVRQHVLARLEPAERQAFTGLADAAPSEGWLHRWLSLAGFRSGAAVQAFLAASIVSVLAGAAGAWMYNRFARPSLRELVAAIPGGSGDAFAAILDAGGWILIVFAVMTPTLVVRAARRRRLAAIERDLPLALELFSTMAEAGLGFDGALARIIATWPPDSPLTFEFAAFQRDLLTGTPRLQALRRMAERSDVGAMTTFTAAVIQAEQVGASIADTLRNQAEALRARRREQALLHAQALPVRLVFPLVICFLPGIFLSTLAPVLYQLIQVADSVLRSSAR